MKIIHICYFTFTIIINMLFELVLSQGDCGPSNLKPEKTADCLKYSNNTDFCCYLNSVDTPIPFKSCINIKFDNVFSYMTVGEMKYTVDCRGVPNYDELFPFEAEYTPCGIANPSIATDCWKYNSEDKPCCLSSIEPSFNSSYDPFCYFYPKNRDFQVAKYSEVNKNGKPLYFSCNSEYYSMKLFIFLSLLLIVLF